MSLAQSQDKKHAKMNSIIFLYTSNKQLGSECLKYTIYNTIEKTYNIGNEFNTISAKPLH